MPKYIPTNYNQNTMVVINFEEQLQPGTFEHAIHYLIDHKLDLSFYDERYKNDETGRKAYNPAILLKIILFAYSKGITSSREIQWCCETNIIFKALSCDTVPHFTTIAGFVSRYPEDMERLFEKVLLVCSDEGLLGNELFAIDGCKMPSNAAKEYSGKLKTLEEKRDKIKKRIRHQLKEHKRLDACHHCDEERHKRNQNKIDTPEVSYAKLDAFLKAAEPRMGHGKKPKEVMSNITGNESAKMKTGKGTIQGYNGVAAVDKKHQIVVDAQAFGEGQEHHTLKPILEAIEERYESLNIDKDIFATEALVTADTGFANEENMEYLHNKDVNAYVPDNQFRSRDPLYTDQKSKYGKRHQEEKRHRGIFFTAREFFFDAKKKTCVCPMGKEMWKKSERPDGFGNFKIHFEGRLTDCRNCRKKAHCMRNPGSADTRKGHGRQVSFILERSKKNKNYTEWMKKRIDGDEGKYIYGHRLSVVEPVFANLESNKGLNRFSLRSKAKVNGQWKLFCIVHNIEKLKNYGNIGLRH